MEKMKKTFTKETVCTRKEGIHPVQRQRESFYSDKKEILLSGAEGILLFRQKPSC
jgi:hypothetical protein